MLRTRSTRISVQHAERHYTLISTSENDKRTTPCALSESCVHHSTRTREEGHPAQEIEALDVPGHRAAALRRRMRLSTRSGAGAQRPGAEHDAAAVAAENWTYAVSAREPAGGGCASRGHQKGAREVGNRLRPASARGRRRGPPRERTRCGMSNTASAGGAVRGENCRFPI